MFRNNVGGVDRIVRAIIGVALIAAFFTYPYLGGWKWVSLFVGLILLFTSVMSTCMIYSVLGMTTRKEDQDDS
jgi:ABC-type polysaccharide/polyol phosphate export permease